MIRGTLAIAAVILIATGPVVVWFQAANAQDDIVGNPRIDQAWGNANELAKHIEEAPVAVSGSNIYTAWNNASASLHGVAIFFTKSNDDGKTFANTTVLSPPNTNPKISVIRENVSIGASDHNVAVTWWTNEKEHLIQ